MLFSSISMKILGQILPYYLKASPSSGASVPATLAMDGLSPCMWPVSTAAVEVVQPQSLATITIFKPEMVLSEAGRGDT